MENELLIKALRWCQTRGCSKCVALLDNGSCKYGGAIKIFEAAADALEAADKRIAIVEEERDLERFAAKNYLDKIDELKAQLPKEGEWIDEQRGRWIYAKCNLCGKVQDVRSNYCPNCGAKMKGENDADN